MATVTTGDPYENTRLVNDQTYCYRVSIQEGTSLISASSEPDCVKPAVDPYWRLGSIAINGDKPTTFKRRVVVTLLSSDVGRTSESVDTIQVAPT